MHLKFDVPGKASPSGSKKAFRHSSSGKVIVMDTAKNKDNWQATVALFAAQAMTNAGQKQTESPVMLHIEFSFARPKSHYGSGKNAEKLKDSAPRHHTQKPDVTKLVRCTEDALTGVVWRDDAAVVMTNAKKQWGESDHVSILVSEV